MVLLVHLSDLRILFIGVLESPEHISDPKSLGRDFKKLQPFPGLSPEPYYGYKAARSSLFFAFHGLIAFYWNLIPSNKTDKSAN